MRKCLCVGIDSYQNVPDLHGCVNDAVSVKEALARNGDGSLNFDVKILTATSENSYVTKKELNDAITELFASDSEIALLYFSGHGSIYDNGGYLCTSEVKCGKEGLSLIDVMKAVNTSRARNKIIILDSCHSGALGDVPFMPEFTVINSGTVILSACENSGYANEEDGHGVYTGLLIEALYGGAMNLRLGRRTWNLLCLILSLCSADTNWEWEHPVILGISHCSQRAANKYLRRKMIRLLIVLNKRSSQSITM